MFSDLTFAELPQLANMNRDAAGVDISLRRAGDLVILEGRADLTIAERPGSRRLAVRVLPRRGDVDERRPDLRRNRRMELRPGVVSTMNAQARYTDPSARSFTGAAIWLGVGSFLVAGLIGALAYTNRDRSPRVGATVDETSRCRLYWRMHSGARKAQRKGRPLSVMHGTVSRRVGRRRHRPIAGVSARAPSRLCLYGYRLRRVDRCSRRVRAARRQAAAAGVRILGLAGGGRGRRRPFRPGRRECAAAVLCARTTARVRAGTRRCHRRVGDPPRAADSAPAVRRAAPQRQLAWAPRNSSESRRRSCSATSRWCGPTTSSPRPICPPTRTDAYSGSGPPSAPRCSAVSTSTSSPSPAAPTSVASAMTVNIYKTASYTISRPLQLGVGCRRRPPRCAGHLPRARHRPGCGVPAARRCARRVRRPGGHRQALG